MASAVVSSVTKKLGDLLIQEALVLYKVDDDVRWIQEELESMQCFLKDADSKQREDVKVKNWVEQIRRVSYDAEDVIETFIYSQNALRRRREFAEWVARCVCIVGELLSELITHYTVGKKIEKIKKRIIDIKKRREEYGIGKIDEGSSSRQSLEEDRRFFALLDEPEVVGQQEEINTLKEQLINEKPWPRVISILGMGGSGKTTLARKVCHDVKNDFDCHAFICLSQQYEMKEVLIRLITCAMGKLRGEIENLTKEELGMMLREHLKGKRYLVVIDDIWSIKAWDDLKLILRPDTGNSKSRVILTTRIKDVAVHAPPVSLLHEMRLLNDNEGWELFMKKVFPGENPSEACPVDLKKTACPAYLEKTGREIFAKCGGLPLAILALGGLLARRDKTLRAWSRVLDSVSQHLNESPGQCMPILALSYWDLPHYLKPCFLYLGLFPEDYEIGSGKLIRLWIAESFIQHKDNKHKTMEDVAEDYLEELVSRSMIQVASKRSNGSIHKCRIHDLLRELSISEARENNFFAVHNDNDTSSSSTSVRRLAVYGNIDGDETKNHSMETLRSILYFFFDSEVDGGLKLPNTSSKLLRVMNAKSEELHIVSAVPKDVGEFVHLKCLEFKFRFVGIPPSIGNLSSLQTLRIFGHSEMLHIPNTIWNLKELRHLYVNSHIKGQSHLSNLTNLQTLSLIAGNWIEEGLDKLTNLRKLKINTGVTVNSYFSSHDTLPCCIQKLCNLRVLELWDLQIVRPHSFLPFLPFLPFTHHRDLYKIHLEGVRIEKLPELPPNLVELYLHGSELQQDAISALEKLQHLKILKLDYKSYMGMQMICSPGGFPKLEFLELLSLPLEEWILKEGAMTSLKSVRNFSMIRLKADTLPKRVRDLLKKGEIRL